MQRTLCNMHDRRLARTGTVGEAGVRHVRRPTLAEKFAATFQPRRMPNGCLEATAGGRDEDGYPVMSFKGQRYRGARTALVLAGRDPAPGEQACHSCDNPLCLDVDHLRWDTNQGNVDDRVGRRRSKGRARAGDLDEARRLHGEGVPLRAIARATGLSRPTIQRHLGLALPPAFAKVLPKDDPRRMKVDA